MKERREERKAEECAGIDRMYSYDKMQYEGCQHMGLYGLTDSDSTPLLLSMGATT